MWNKSFVIDGSIFIRVDFYCALIIIGWRFVCRLRIYPLKKHFTQSVMIDINWPSVQSSATWATKNIHWWVFTFLYVQYPKACFNEDRNVVCIFV